MTKKITRFIMITRRKEIAMPQSLSCSSLLTQYHAWKSAVSFFKDTIKIYERDATKDAEETMRAAKERAESLHKEFQEMAHQKTEFQGNPCLAIEKMVLETMGAMINSNVPITSTNGRITTLNVSDIKSQSLTHALSFVPMLDTLTVLYCSYTSITELPKLPDTLTVLYCSYTSITELPKLPDTLAVLSCDNTSITELPKLSGILTTLTCFNTSITELPKLPDTLRMLNCYNTSITELPKLPDTLTWLNCLNTPAANDPETITQLEAFKKAHPNAKIIY